MAISTFETLPYARLWKPYLIEFMATLGPEQTGAAAVHEARGLS
jgi:hypothetical protein